MGEFDLIGLIGERAANTRADVVLGIGDDGALLQPPSGQQLVAVTDTLVAAVHFPATTAARDLGWKALAVNLSDLAAMGATPAWALLALTLPQADRGFVGEFLDGLLELAAASHIALAGGDTARGPLSVTVSALGFVPPGQALRRDGARPGDLVYVTGSLGDAAAGLHCRTQHGGGVAAAHRAVLLARLERPEPRIAAGAALRGVASSCIDVSDGLLADLGHVARASAVAIEIDAGSLPVSPALLASFEPSRRRAWQLAGGDDYELAFTVSPAGVERAVADLARLGCGATRIGRVLAGSGVRALDADGAGIAMTGPGWDHFA
jgi:thiamine-monophosphate kinase